MKTACIYHSIDLDGWMSAAIVKHWFIENNIDYTIVNINDQSGGMYGKTDKATNNRIDFIGYNYGQPIPDLSEYDKVIMCDISFPKEEMSNIRGKKGNNFIWIDHHISAINDAKEIFKEYYETFNGTRDTTYAACELTWQYFFPNEQMPEIVRLLGRYDCFGHKGTDEEQKVLEFQYGARQCIGNYEEAYKYLQFSLQGIINYDFVSENTIEDRILEQGKTIYQYLCTEAKQAYKNGFEIKLNVINKIPDIKELGFKNASNQRNYKFICINKERFNPINFGIDYHKDGYDGAACFHFDGTHWCFSLYNDNGLVDCSQIAKQFGGGGHKGAAGFRLGFKDNSIDSFIRARI